MASKSRLRARQTKATEENSEKLDEVLTVVNRLDRKLNKLAKELRALSGAIGEDEDAD
jgi:hypothetical protein